MASTISAGTTTTTSLVYTADTSGVLQLQTNGTTTAVTIDTAQNVGIGLTPSAFNGGWIQVKNGTGIVSNYSMNVGSNYYYDGTYNRYTNTAAASYYNQNAGNHIWWTAPSGTAGNPISGANAFVQAMTLDNSGRLLIGTTSGSYGLVVGTGSTDIRAQINGSTQYQLQMVNGSNSGFWIGSPSADAMAFSRGDGVERMRIDNSGNLLVGQTTQTYTSVGFSVLGTGSAAPGTVNSTLAASTNALSSYNLYSTGASAFRFYVDLAGTIHATSTSITAISDASLKTNIKPLETGLAEINRLQPRRFDWLDQDKNEGTNIAGFISQEVQEVLPDLTPNFKYNETETKLGLKMGDMIPTMVKAIQELSAKVTALEAKVGA